MNSADQLRELLAGQDILAVPGCYDAISAKLIERAGFPATFMGGFGVSASRIGMPDTGLISYAEMLDQGRNICNAVSFPVFGDGDTGYGNAMNVQRTVKGYAQTGFACIMIEDQVSPKRCGHTRGKQTVSREEAFARIKAAVDVRDAGTDILIMARTDANGTEGLNEAIFRAEKFAEIGADITFLEAPRNEEEMRAYCSRVPGPKMANMVEQGVTPVLPPSELREIGYKIVAYPLTLILAGIRAMESALSSLRREESPRTLAEFSHLREIIGFPEYYEAEKKYAADRAV
ncbi:isocitrate lyase/PEP mutase family protein [Desulfococcaceae bacterium HSG8]|nr:isocitrate lyase/PEP mutase family protein [Desulfococcaceae bacterium HSG8]